PAIGGRHHPPALVEPRAEPVSLRNVGGTRYRGRGCFSVTRDEGRWPPRESRWLSGYSAIRRRVESSRRRSPGSDVTAGWPARRAQITTWASVMSEVLLAASSLPTLVASTRS